MEYKGLPRALPRDDHPFTRPISVAEIIEHSSNRGAAQLGMQLGEERLWTYARAFGFGELTGFRDIYPETPGMLANWTKWSGSDITRIPMGHTIAASPLQIHMAMAVIAGGGELLRPQLVREVRDPAGVVVYHFDRDARRRVIGAATARTMAGLLTGVVSAEGTAPEAAIPGFDAAGKTGTTKKLIDGKYSTTHHVASFVGFFPAGGPRGCDFGDCGRWSSAGRRHRLRPARRRAEFQAPRRTAHPLSRHQARRRTGRPGVFTARPARRPPVITYLPTNHPLAHAFQCGRAPPPAAAAPRLSAPTFSKWPPSSPTASARTPSWP